MSMSKRSCGRKGGEEVFSFSLVNGSGMKVSCLNFGCVLTGIWVADHKGRFGNVVLHYERAEDYFDDPYYVGAVVGRYANRIAWGSFPIGERTCRLTVNEKGPQNHLHGGFSGFNRKVWKVVEENSAMNRIVFGYLSPDGEEGYPGNLEVRVTYWLREDNSLEISYKARTDATTIVNLTNHSYFDLSAGESSGILDHRIMVHASAYTPLDDRYIPLGSKCAVAGTSFDLRREAEVRAIAGLTPTINYCLEAGTGPAAELSDPAAGRRLAIHTTQPGMQLYFGNFLSSPFTPFSGVCLEPQHYPDSPNHTSFPSTFLQPHEPYDQRTVYRFFSSW